MPFTVLLFVVTRRFDVYCIDDAVDRFKCDSNWNQRPVSKLGPRGTFDSVQSRALRVGHVIKVDCDSEFPADVVLLQVCDAFCCNLVLSRIACAFFVFCFCQCAAAE